jgi:hypothetical protein
MLMEYDFKVVHIASLVNMDTNGLSRNLVPSQADAIGAKWHVDNGEDSLPKRHCLTFLCLLLMNGDTTKDATMATVDEDGGEESGSALGGGTSYKTYLLYASNKYYRGGIRLQNLI